MAEEWDMRNVVHTMGFLRWQSLTVPRIAGGCFQEGNGKDVEMGSSFKVDF